MANAERSPVRHPFLESEDFECGIVANLSDPSSSVYYLLTKSGNKVVSAESLNKLIEVAANDLHDGDLACVWLLSRPYIALSGHGDWLPNTIRTLCPEAVTVIDDITYINPKIVSFDLSQISNFGWISNDDGWLHYSVEHDKHFQLHTHPKSSK